ncbi:MAG: hypothetical protein ICV72_13560, partial [Aldersonia sp.]|nr:hypothetical protein [Aldersonia sp.]
MRTARMLVLAVGFLAATIGLVAPAAADPVGVPGFGPSPIVIGVPPWSTVMGQAWPTAESGRALIRVVADAGFTGVHAELDVGWVNISTGASGGYHVSRDYPAFAGRWDDRVVETGRGTVVVTVTGVLTALPGQGAPWAPVGVVAPIITPSVYANE